MANRYWIGGAYPVAQVATVQITGNDAATTYKLTIGTLVISVTGAGSAALTAAALQAAWEASEHPYATAITASVNSDIVTLTADEAGVPFTVTSSVTGGAGTIGSVTTTTSNSGPNDFGTAANWSGDTVPVNGDSVELGNREWPILWGLDQSSKTFATLIVDESFADGMVGLNPNVFQTSATASDSTVKEYRDCYLKCGATIFINRSQTPRLLVNFGSVQTTATITDSATTAADGDELEPIRLLGTHPSNAIYVSGGIVGVATTQQKAEVSTFATVAAGAAGEAAGGNPPVVRLGVGCTLTNIRCGAATIVNYGANVTLLDVIDLLGSYTAFGTATHGTVTNRGTINYRTSGTITSYAGDGIFDTTLDARAKTISAMVVYKGADVRLNTGTPLSVTLTTGIDLVGCGLADVSIDFGPNLTVTPSAL